MARDTVPGPEDSTKWASGARFCVRQPHPQRQAWAGPAAPAQGSACMDSVPSAPAPLRYAYRVLGPWLHAILGEGAGHCSLVQHHWGRSPSGPQEGPLLQRRGLGPHSPKNPCPDLQDPASDAEAPLGISASSVRGPPALHRPSVHRRVRRAGGKFMTLDNGVWVE